MATRTTAPALRPAASFRRLVALARSEWRALLGGSVFLALGSVMNLAFPQGVRLIVDGVNQGHALLHLDRTAGLLAAVALLFGLSSGLRQVLFATAGERIITRLRQDLYRSLIDQEIAFFDDRRTGELMSRLSSDTGVLQRAVSWNISIGLRHSAQALGGLALLIYTSPRLTALMMAVVPLVAVGGVIYGRRVRKLARDAQDALAAAGEVAEESLAGIRTVRSFVAEDKEAARYGAAVDTALGLARRRIKVSAAFMGTTAFASYAAAVLVFWYGARLVSRGQLSLGALTSFLMYTMLVAYAIASLTDLYADVMRALGAAERVFELRDRTPAIPPAGGLRPDSPVGRASLREVRFAYPSRPDVPVLDGVTLDLAPGEVVALVGPSGAGKSTIAALLARFYDPDAGDVRFDGHDVRTLDPRWLRTQIGTVAQEPILFGTSILENIRYGRPGASDEDVRRAAEAANVHTFVARFPEGLDTRVGERGVQLSGGQKQRVAIARAVLKDPRLLILDEATSALDAESEHLVKEALDRLMRDRTTLIIAHRLSTVRDADRVVVLDHGKVAQNGPHAQLVEEEGLYRRLVERQFSLSR